MATWSDALAVASETLPSVLVVDDDPELRALLCEYLAMRGHDVLDAPNGFDAVSLVERQTPRVVLIDLEMPHVGGLEAARLIQRLDATIRIIVMTGAATRELAGRLRAMGIALLPKPFELSDVDALVR